MQDLRERPMDGRTFARVGANFYEYASGTPLPPTREEWAEAGASVVAYDATRTTCKPVHNPRNVSTTVIPSLDSTRYAAPTVTAGGRKVVCDWASRVTIVSVPCGDTWITHATIAVTRDNKRAYVFDSKGRPMGTVKVRKHYKPAWLQSEMGLAYVPRVNTFPMHISSGSGEKCVARKSGAPTIARQTDYALAPKLQYDEHVYIDDMDAIPTRRVISDSLDMSVAANIQTRTLERDAYIAATIDDATAAEKPAAWKRSEYKPKKRPRKKRTTKTTSDAQFEIV